MLFAQGSELAAWSTFASVIVQLGFSVFIAIYYVVKKEPADRDAHLKAVQEERKIWADREVLRNQESKEKIALIVADNKEALKAVIAHCERESVRRDEALKSAMATVDKSLINVMDVLEEIRDEKRLEQGKAPKRRGGQ